MSQLNLIIPILVIALAIVIIAAIFLTIKKEQREPDYRALFTMGAIFLAIYFFSSLSGLYEPVSVFLILGLVFFIMGLANKNRWGKPRRLLTEKEIKTQRIVMIAAVVLVVLGIFVFLLIP